MEIARIFGTLRDDILVLTGNINLPHSYILTFHFLYSLKWKNRQLKFREKVNFG